MSLQDPISDMLIRIKNAQAMRKASVSMPSTKVKVEIAKLLKQEGYVADWSAEIPEGEDFPQLTLALKYTVDADNVKRPVIDMMKRVSRCSRRVYSSHKDLPEVENGLGVAIVSTNKGLMTDAQARSAGLGGEVWFYVS